MEQDFVFFEDWVYKNLAIDLSAYKPKQLHRRILSIMKRTGHKNLREFSRSIRMDEKVRVQFLDYITINVTEFFRNKPMFDNLENIIRDVVLPNCSNLKVWSAACSIGAEPYSIAMILDRINRKGCNYILATDIDENILQKARQGIYNPNEIKNVSIEDRKKYFVEDQGKFLIRKSLKKDVVFKKHDLILEPYEKDFNLILCRNVVIYFNNEMKNSMYHRFYDALVPGGLLFVGATETIYNYRDFGFEKVANFLYQKKNK